VYGKSRRDPVVFYVFKQTACNVLGGLHGALCRACADRGAHEQHVMICEPLLWLLPLALMLVATGNTLTKVRLLAASNSLQIANPQTLRVRDDSCERAWRARCSGCGYCGYMRGWFCPQGKNTQLQISSIDL
jgi:hypothetical protein